VEKLNGLVNRILSEPEIRSHIAFAGARIETLTPDQFADFVRSERPKWIEIIRAAGVQPQ
jgi:tripartite-type tricarboxylate transporter receptor subunit TctC